MAFTFWARQDNNNANNPALNLTGDAAIELEFVADGLLGDLTMETNGGGTDPDTLVEIGGAAYNFTFELSGTMPTLKKNGAQQVPDQFEGSVVVIITVQDYPTAGDATRLSFMPLEGATEAEMNAFGNGAIDVQGATTTPTALPVCFVRGTRILTPDGERKVEDLSVGDRVCTANGGIAELRWVAKSHFGFADMLASVDVRPVCIPRGYLGHGLPHSDLWVSPQHRLVLGGWQAELTCGLEEVFIPAKHLIGPGRFPGPEWRDGVDYFHVLFDGHEIVLSNGLPSESLFPGEEALTCVGPEAHRSLEAFLRSTAQGAFQQTALPTLKAHEARVLSAQYQDLPRAA